LFVCMGVFLAVINFHLGNVWTWSLSNEQVSVGITSVHCECTHCSFLVMSEISVVVGGIYTQGLLDKIMGEIPGNDNYPGVLHDSTFGLETLDARYPRNKTLLNTAYYHRYYRCPLMSVCYICEVVWIPWK
jgi:hypothetical protein